MINSVNYGDCISAVRVCIQLFQVKNICHPDYMRGPLPTVPLDCGYGRHIHEVFNEKLMIATVSLPPFILTSIGQVPLYPDRLPKMLYIPVVASAYGNISCILYLDYPADDPMFGCHLCNLG